MLTRRNTNYLFFLQFIKCSVYHAIFCLTVDVVIDSVPIPIFIGQCAPFSAIAFFGNSFPFFIYFCSIMFYDIEDLKLSHFKRLTGVKREIFETMLEVINNAKAKLRKHPTRGTRPNLSNAGKLLLMLMYYREYRTQFHIGITYGSSESHVCEIIKEIENILIQDSGFHLPGKKALLKEENHFETVLVDVTESPVERPKKNRS
jgi:hypothetical protein